MEHGKIWRHKQLLLKSAVGAIVLAIGGGVASAAAEGFAITVTVAGIKEHEGEVNCSLYSKEKGFPMKKPIFAEQRVPVKSGSEKCVFTNVPAGVYAIAVYQDEDSDGKVDTNMIGIPLEPVGVSNNPKPAMRAPTFDEAKFEVSKDVSMKVVVRK
jgi:uncharacterized protein (DUF2141 family)